MDLSIDPVMGLTCRLLLVFVFAPAIMHKLASARRFVAVLKGYRVIPEVLVNPVAVLVICAETFAVVGIWWPESRAWAAAVAVALLATYAVAIGINLARGRREIDCGCSFGAAEQPLSPALLIRNALLMLPCAGAGLAVTAPLESVGAVIGLLAALALGLCYQVWGALLANRPRMQQLEGFR